MQPPKNARPGRRDERPKASRAVSTRARAKRPSANAGVTALPRLGATGDQARAQLLALQSSHGNKRVQRLADLKDQAGKLEEEADDVAVRMALAAGRQRDAFLMVRQALKEIAKRDKQVKWLLVDFAKEFIPEPYEKAASLAIKGTKLALALSDTMQPLEERVRKELKPTALEAVFLQQIERFEAKIELFQDESSTSKFHDRLDNEELDFQTALGELKFLKRKYSVKNLSTEVFKARMEKQIADYRKMVEPIKDTHPSQYGERNVALWIMLKHGQYLALVHEIPIAGSFTFVRWIGESVKDPAIQKTKELTEGQWPHVVPASWIKELPSASVREGRPTFPFTEVPLAWVAAVNESRELVRAKERRMPKRGESGREPIRSSHGR